MRYSHPLKGRKQKPEHIAKRTEAMLESPKWKAYVKRKKGIAPKNLELLHKLPRTEEWKRKIAEAHLGEGSGFYKDGRWSDPEYRKESAVRYYQENKEEHRFHNRLRKHRKRGAGGEYSKTEWEQLKIKYNNTCPCCGKPEPEIVLTIDHIKPIALGGTNDATNIQPLCLVCNKKKYIKVIYYET